MPPALEKPRTQTEYKPADDPPRLPQVTTQEIVNRFLELFNWIELTVVANYLQFLLERGAREETLWGKKGRRQRDPPAFSPSLFRPPPMADYRNQPAPAGTTRIL